jgi:hypothetical protein
MYNNTKMIRAYTRDLQDKRLLKTYMSLGFQHIRRIVSIERFPTIGCLAELCLIPNIGTVPIDSPQGRRLINKMSYF